MSIEEITAVRRPTLRYYAPYYSPAALADADGELIAWIGPGGVSRVEVPANPRAIDSVLDQIGLLDGRGVMLAGANVTTLRAAAQVARSRMLPTFVAYTGPDEDDLDWVGLGLADQVVDGASTFA